VQAYLAEAMDDEKGLISRSLCKIFIVNPLQMVPVSGIDMVRQLSQWYE
jgi:hypothetical protein